MRSPRLKLATSINTHPSLREDEFKVLVINSSQEMAKEITLQLTLNMPGCSLMYAPTIELARWILSRRKIDLVVSSPILPDGSIVKLKSVLEKHSSPPNVVVVGDLSRTVADVFEHSGYEIATVKRIGQLESKHIERRSAEASKTQFKAKMPTQARKNHLVPQVIESLGADLRNDLNNPLQAIVAMVFVAKARAGSSAATAEALDAIDHAAKNLAHVVQGLEQKIRAAVEIG